MCRPSKFRLHSCLFLLLLLALVVRAQRGGGWVAESRNMADAAVINYINFFDGRNGVVAGYGRFIRYTTDGGKEWLKPILPPSFSELEEKDDIIDGSVVNGRRERTIYLLSYKSLLRSNNDGESWEELPDPAGRLRRLLPASIGVQYKDVDFVSDSKGWVLCRVFKVNKGTGTFFRSYVLQTNDAGQTWEPTEVGLPEKPGQPNRKMYRMHFIDSDKGWIVGENGTILYTDNGGERWGPQSYPLREGEKVLGSKPTLLDITCRGKKGIIIGDQGTILRMEDGKHWFHVPDIKPRAASLVFKRIHMVDEEQAWIVSESGGIFRTKDGGISWKPQGSYTDKNLYAIFMCNRELGWAAGDRTFLTYYAGDDGRGDDRRRGGSFGAADEPWARSTLVTCHD